MYIRISISYSLYIVFFFPSLEFLEAIIRPFPDAAANNEPWDTAFDVFGMPGPRSIVCSEGHVVPRIAMATNVAVVVFASNVFEGWSCGA